MSVKYKFVCVGETRLLIVNAGIFNENKKYIIHYIKRCETVMTKEFCTFLTSLGFETKDSIYFCNDTEIPFVSTFHCIFSYKGDNFNSAKAKFLMHVG